MIQVEGWTTLAEQPLVLVKEYSFAREAVANALVIGLPDRKLLIVSPPCGVPTEDLKALDSCGKVVALLAFNGAHHLGLGLSRSAFPQAITYASERAAARINKKAKDAGTLVAIDALIPLLGDKVSVLPVEGDKLGDVLVRVKTEKGTLLFAGDFIANIARLPRNLMMRWAFTLTDSAPGLKVFRLFFKFFVKNRSAARDFLVREVESHPPEILVPAHGDVVAVAGLGQTLASMLRTAV